jgi:hypothetical protein
MECQHKPVNRIGSGTPVPGYSDEKISRIREKIRVVFGNDCSMNNTTLSNRYDITDDGDLILIIR